MTRISDIKTQRRRRRRRFPSALLPARIYSSSLYMSIDPDSATDGDAALESDIVVVTESDPSESAGFSLLISLKFTKRLHSYESERRC